MSSGKNDIRIMFNAIAHRYDFLNHFLSFGTDRRWREKLLKIVSEKHPRHILDVATGTGDLAIALAALKPEMITGIDIAENMLDIARKKVAARHLEDIISLKKGDAEHIPFPDDAFDAVTVAFGVRNFENLLNGLKEMRRVLKPGAILIILEFSHPRKFPVKQLYSLYSRFLIPFFGRMFSGNYEAYRYLPDSISHFPSGKDFIEILKEAGLKNNFLVHLSSGISTIYVSEK
jgi:demethylmenaquinone methyltransferase/2-methoxy-6-polyprenyl-1,4-benzoquinol methylase